MQPILLLYNLYFCWEYFLTSVLAWYCKFRGFGGAVVLIKVATTKQKQRNWPLVNQRVPLVGLNSDHSRSNILHIADSLLIYAFHFNLHCAVQGFIWIGGGRVAFVPSWNLWTLHKVWEQDQWCPPSFLSVSFWPLLTNLLNEPLLLQSFTTKDCIAKATVHTCMYKS